MRMSVDVSDGPPTLHALVEQVLCAVMVKVIVNACCGSTRAVPASVGRLCKYEVRLIQAK